jgi:hypothetical protein
MTNLFEANERITKEVESILLDIFSDNPIESYPAKDLVDMVANKISDKYRGIDLASYVNWAADLLYSNRLIKKVGPNIWQSIDGPDPIYADRSTGYAPEGEFAPRGKNFLSSNMSPTDRKQFNSDFRKAEVSVKMLKTVGMTPKETFDALKETNNFNMIAVKIAIKKIYALPNGKNDIEKSGDDIDLSIFGNDIDFEK